MKRPSKMGGMTRLKTSPIPVERTTRAQQHRVLTSMPAGKMVPLAAIPLLREDSVSRANFSIGFEMMETVEILMNSVNVRVMAYLVPKLALERFDGLDSLNKSYEGLPPYEGGTVVPWFEMATAPAHGANKVLTYMGKHFRSGTQINTEYTEAYNAIWNYRAKNRSPDIAMRTLTDGTLAPAFWLHQNFAHIVPDFDQAIIDGEVALNVVNAKMPVKGLGILSQAGVNPGNLANVRESGETATKSYATGYYGRGVTPSIAAEGNIAVQMTTGLQSTAYPDVWAELQQNGITVSLSNIDMARKTQAFAALRRQYNGHSDEYIIDLLMDGITIPEQVWKNPVLIYDGQTVFGATKRYASDGDNLTQSVVNGMASLNFSFTVPRCPTGGVVMIVAEAMPEQLFERQQDPYLHAGTVDDLPQFLRDTLDPEKVQIVKNEEVDLDHDTPTHTFGYAPLNHQWVRNIPQIGGKFYRPAVDAAFDEDRQRIWAVETQNPVLSADFYLCTTMHMKPFSVTTGDAFEALLRGETMIRGNTVFGGPLIEATNDYAEIVEEQPSDRIEKP
jgi:hypothetical protein